jgi:acetyl esterase/lipase
MTRIAAGMIGLLLVASCASRANACANVPSLVDEYTAVYGTDPISESLDLYYPDGVHGEPLVVFVHGGMWSHGDKAEYVDVGNTFAACGIALAIVNYPHAPAVRPDKQAADVAKAVKWLVDRANHNTYAASRLFLFGHSAGAEIVALLIAGGYRALPAAGLDKNAVAGAIAMDGTGYDPYKQTQGIGFHLQRLYEFASAFGSDPSKWKPYDVHQYLTGKEPPLLVVHATSDTIAPEYESSDFVDELKAAGDTVTYLQASDRDHFSVLRLMTDGSGDPTFDAVVRFVTGE